jgi:hypothetical protein
MMLHDKKTTGCRWFHARKRSGTQIFKTKCPKGLKIIKGFERVIYIFHFENMPCFISLKSALSASTAHLCRNKVKSDSSDPLWRTSKNNDPDQTP